MLDRYTIPVVEKILDPFGERLFQAKMNAEILSLAGFAFTLVAAFLAGVELYYVALSAFILGRLLDGLGEASGRAGGITAFGRYLDLVLHFIGFALIPLGFAFATESNGLISAILVVSLLALGASDLGYAGVARGLQKKSDVSGNSLFDFCAAMVGTTELTLGFVIMFLMPAFYPAVAILLSIAILAACVFRVLKARLVFSK